ncbi:RibD family protein [Cryptosporangium phraense]|uniref:Deaminase n=1 Tax=Cryptosporangium phraense TaxID=2593070 RepID=A0A545AWM1_9ACTN|nr:dihydrofolate reductase family protein [Cryptosporangium phraense]TQS45727.1 deaminase [Cryptosporangium phraense]
MRPHAGLKPYVIVSAAMSVDGYLDDTSPQRLLLSNEADFDRVDAVRAGCDAILVGAETVRRDDPRLLVRSAARREARVAAGLTPSPLRIVLSRSGSLDPGAAVFGPGAETVVYPGVPQVLADRRIRRLLVEGGSSVQAQFLTEGLVDELHLAVAPFFVGEPSAPRFAGVTKNPHWMRLAETRTMGDVVLLRYLLGPPDGD